MPGRLHPLITGNIYHVFNKSIEKKVIFSKEFCNVFLKTAFYYRSSQSILRYSNFQKLSPPLMEFYMRKVQNKRAYRISILAFCLMPTHYHLLLQQNQEGGISTFLSQLQNSFTRFYNIKTHRSGPIFLQKFKSKPILSEEMLKHVSRYIYLNPYSSGLIKTIDEIKNYSHSSFFEYIIEDAHTLCDIDYCPNCWVHYRKRYEDFVLDNAEYQKTLEYCKYSNKW